MTIRDFFNTLNGWQRIYVAMVLYAIVYTVSEMYDAIQYNSLRDNFLEIIGTAIGVLALIYFIGWMVAWIRRGFKSK